jgi:hypothetical protein
LQISLEVEATMNLAQQQAAEMAALLVRYREQFGELRETNDGET